MYITFEEDKSVDQEEVKPSGESRQTEIAGPGFTPGPWKAVGYSPGWWQIEGPEREQLADVNYSDGADEPTLYPEEANARLIAASPAMFEYLKRKADEGDVDAAGIIANI